MTAVYWIRNNECQQIETSGYVGVSDNPQHRFKQHMKRNLRIPKDAQLEIIFEGTREECFAKEHELRPLKGIGWNRAVGGAQGFKQGFIHSEFTRQKLRNAWTEERKNNASALRKEINRSLIGQKRPKQSESMRGSKNSMYGKSHTEESRKKMSAAQIGRVAPNRQEIYCVGCHERVSHHVLVNRHNKCFKLKFNHSKEIQ